jgi:hypothetical protein
VGARTDAKHAHVEPEELGRLLGQAAHRLCHPRLALALGNLQHAQVAVVEGHVGQVGAAVVEARQQQRVEQQVAGGPGVVIGRHRAPAQGRIKTA